MSAITSATSTARTNPTPSGASASRRTPANSSRDFTPTGNTAPLYSGAFLIQDTNRQESIRMGWLFRRGPLLHLNSYVREICGTYEAYEVEVAGSPTEITKENLKRGNYQHAYIDVWFLTRATKDGEPVICQMLVDFDATAKGTTGLPRLRRRGREGVPARRSTGAGVGIQDTRLRQRIRLAHLPDEISGRCADCARRARRGVEGGDESPRRHNVLASLK